VIGKLNGEKDNRGSGPGKC